MPEKHVHRHLDGRDPIDVTGIDLVKLLQVAYDLSHPQGAGFIQYRPGGLSDAQAQAHIERCAKFDHIALIADYVHGRAVKLQVRRMNGKLLLVAPWLDHTDEDLEKLLRLNKKDSAECP